MICDRGPFNQCDYCHMRWVVMPDTPTGEPQPLCFGTEAEARAAYNQIEATNEYAGLRFRPRSAVLFAPKEEQE